MTELAPAVTDDSVPAGAWARIRPHLTVAALDDGGVLVHGERVSRVFSGSLYERLLPMLDGTRHPETIADALEEEFTRPGVAYAMMQLRALDFLEDLEAAPRPASLRIALRVMGDDESSASWAGRLSKYGIRADANADLTVMITPDYLDERLADVNREALAETRPWLLCRPYGTVLWFGPYFEPGKGACWACLRQRLQRNLPVDAYLALRHVRPRAEAGMTPATRQAAAALLAGQLSRVAANRSGDLLAGAIVTLDTETLESRRHVVQQRPQCPFCGNPWLYGRRPGQRIVLSPGPASVGAGSGHRTVAPGDTVARWMSQVDPLTGVVSALERIDGGAPGVHVYAAGANLATPRDTWRDLRASLRRSSGGKGLCDAQARASALGEAVERYSGRFEGDEPRLRASYRALGDAAIHPNSCMLFSERQLRDRGALGEGQWGLDRIPVPFDDDKPEYWTPVWSLTSGRPMYLPTGLLYFRFHDSPAHARTIADSNGNAAGNSVEEAILQGFFELVERDSTAIWWYNRIQRPGVDLDSFDAPEWPALRVEYQRIGRDVWMLDLTSDLGIPVFAAVSRRREAGPESILLGLGAHVDAGIAATRALSEMNQMLVTVDAEGGASIAHEGLGEWLRGARLADHAYLAPAPGNQRLLQAFPTHQAGDLRDSVLWCQDLIQRHGLEMLVLDQTRPDVDIPVVKVIVPGLRHFRARFAPGRLYDVPVALGWRDRAVEEVSLNPTPFFL